MPNIIRFGCFLLVFLNVYIISFSKYQMSTMTENNLFKYRIGKRWFTFDKSRLDEQDKNIFDRANWSDKLNIIKIYNDLKPVEDDTIITLKTKKENPNKDKRRAEYLKKKEDINNKITALNSDPTATNEQFEKLKSEMNNLNIEYADVINVNNVQNMSVNNTTTLTLNNVKTIIDKTAKQVDELEKNLTKEDINSIKENIRDLLEARDSENLDETITEIKDTIKTISENTLSDIVKSEVETLQKNIEELKTQLNTVEDDEKLNYILTLLGDRLSSNASILRRYMAAREFANSYNITDEDIAILKGNEKATEYLKERNNIKFAHYIAQYIKLYDYLMKLETETKIADGKEVNTCSFITVSFSDNEKRPLNAEYFNIFDGNKLTDFFNALQLSEKNAEKKNIFTYYSPSTRDKDPSKIDYQHGTIFGTEVLYNKEHNSDLYNLISNMSKIMIRTGSGFLGLKTDKSFKKDYDKLLSIVSDLRSELANVKKEFETLKVGAKQPQNKFETIGEKGYNIDINKAKPVNETNRVSHGYNFLEDLTKPIQLKPVEKPTSKYNYSDRTGVEKDLYETMKRRREDIEYSDDDSEEWGDGIGSPLRGGLLQELQRDLRKYGLMFSRSSDDNAFFIKVFTRRKPWGEDAKNKDSKTGNGVEEAAKLVNETNKKSTYKDLKELYEDLYN